MNTVICNHALWVVVAACCLGAAAGEELSPAPAAPPRLHPSFPDYALAARPVAGPRDSPGPALDVPPFSWTQNTVFKEGTTGFVLLQGFDPQSQPLQFNLMPPAGPLQITSFDPKTGQLQFSIPLGLAGTIETLPFQITGHGVTPPVTYDLLIDIRDSKARIRPPPFLLRSPGDTIKPGQVVEYVWTLTASGVKTPKCEALLTGETGPAVGISSSAVTELLAVKVRPAVLGYYLMEVTPRDVRGETAQGGNSPGRVFQCAFGTNNLPPATDGMMADSFLPTVGQTITLQPNAIDPETAQTVFSNEVFDFGDGTVLTGVTGSATHAYATPGIYTASCTVADNLGATAVARDNIIVGATVVPQLSFSCVKQIVPDEAGDGELQQDSLKATFKGINAGPGDRIVFTFNRNRFGRLSASDPGDDTDIVLTNGSFSGATRLAKSVTVASSGGAIAVNVSGAQFDRTGDPRLGRAELKGIFKNQRIGVCVVSANGGPVQVQVYTGNISIGVKGGALNTLIFIPEQTLGGKATTLEPNPKRQEVVTDVSSTPGIEN